MLFWKDGLVKKKNRKDVQWIMLYKYGVLRLSSDPMGKGMKMTTCMGDGGGGVLGASCLARLA